jgi:replicative DNA helicase
MKLFAREHKIAIIALQQLGRDMGSTKERGDLSYQEPFMNNLRDSGGIEQDVDKALFLYRRKPANEKEKFLVENGKTLVVCKIDKNRSGKIGKIDMVFDGEVQRFKEAEINEQSNNKQ